MTVSGIDQTGDDVESGDDSLLNVARAVWQARWLVLACLVVGALLGIWYEGEQPQFRTTTTLRWQSPHISYLYSGYWTITGSIRAGQVRAMIGNHPQGSRIALRTEKDPWIVRLEVLHDRPGEGREVSEEILQGLAKLDEQTAVAGRSSEGSEETLLLLHRTLTELEMELAAIPEAASTVPGFSDDPASRLNQQFTSEAGPRIPLENLPLFPWYRSLQVRTSQLLSATASGSGTEIPPQTIQRLMELQQASTAQLLQYWWSLDLLVSTGPLPVPSVEAISEQPVGGNRRRLQAALVGLWIAGLAAVLLAVPLRWLRLRWRDIVRPENPTSR